MEELSATTKPDNNTNHNQSPVASSNIANIIKLQRLTHLTDYIPHLQTHANPLDHSHFFHPISGFYLSPTDVILRNILFDLSSAAETTFCVCTTNNNTNTNNNNNNKNNNDTSAPGPGGHQLAAYHRAGPRKHIYFGHVRAAIVTCGGLCPGMNTVIRELVVGLWDLYGVHEIFGIKAGYRGFYSTCPVPLNPKMVHDLHKRGGTILETSRGGFDLHQIVNAIQDRGYSQVRNIQILVFIYSF